MRAGRAMAACLSRQRTRTTTRRSKLNVAHRTAIASSAILVLGLAACGGGGDDPPAAVPSAPIAPASITCPGSAAVLTKQTIVVNGITREYYETAPTNVADLRENDAKGIGLVVNFHDVGEDGQKGAASSCWNEVGQSSGFVTIFPSAVNGSWNTTASATGSDEVAFIKALVPAIKTKYALASNNQVYYTGYGQGARQAQAMAMQAAQYVGGVAAVGGSAEASVFALPAAQLPPTTMASWIISSFSASADPTQSKQIDYWNSQNGVYSAGADTVDASFKSKTFATTDRPMQQVIVSTILPAVAQSGKTLSQAIWDRFFSKSLRFLDDDRVNGSVRLNQTTTEMTLIDESKAFVAGTTRRWLTYLPTNYSALTAGGKKIPLVFNLHGRNGSAHWQAVTTRWHEVAEQNGFIMVYPQGQGATWSTDIGTSNTDVSFMLSLIGELQSKYAVDPTRIYLNGVSMGAAMTNRIAVQYPQLFAAIAPCYSGHLSAANYANAIVRTDVPLPTWQCRGADEVPSDFPGGAGGEAAAQVFWRETVNHNSGVPTLQLDGRKVTQIWNNGAAEYRWQVTEYQPHFWHEGEASKLWTEMFAKYQRAPDGTLIKLP
jgi:poly(3-hydroxybutyrate) depolymerase